MKSQSFSKLQTPSSGDNEICNQKESTILPINLTTIYHDYPKVEESFNGCEYNYPYIRLNDLFNYPTRIKYPILSQPKSCAKKKSNEILILMGVKSLPNAPEGRNALRKTWLRLLIDNDRFNSIFSSFH